MSGFDVDAKPPKGIVCHQFSPEQLIHFVCGRCRKPWTVSADMDVTARSWTCTHCTYIAWLKPMPSMMEENADSTELLNKFQRDSLMRGMGGTRQRMNQFWQRHWRRFRKLWR